METVTLRDPSYRSPLERELFTDTEITRTDKLQPTAQPTEVNEAELEAVLTKKQLLAYESAKKFKNADIIREILEA